MNEFERSRSLAVVFFLASKMALELSVISSLLDYYRLE